MKMFNALEFTQHDVGFGNTKSKVFFDNGYGASVFCGEMFYTDFNHPYELAVLTSDGSLCYTTPLTDDVIGYLTAQDVDDMLILISKLPKE